MITSKYTVKLNVCIPNVLLIPNQCHETYCYEHSIKNKENIAVSMRYPPLAADGTYDDQQAVDDIETKANPY